MQWKKLEIVILTNVNFIQKDYMEDVHGKEIPLQYVTVKVPGQKPRGSKTVSQSNGSNDALSSITSELYLRMHV